MIISYYFSNPFYIQGDLNFGCLGVRKIHGYICTRGYIEKSLKTYEGMPNLFAP